MDIIEIFRVAIKSLRTNKIRSFLTMLGIIIGVFSVILLISIGSGLQHLINSQFESLGTNIVLVMPGKLIDDSGKMGTMQGMPNFAGSKLNSSHVKGILRLGAPIVNASGRNEIPVLASALNGKNTFTTVMGIDGGYSVVRNTKAQKGRFINQNDVISGKRVAAIGPSLADKIFKKTDPLGKEFRLGDNRFKVVGLVEKKGAGMSMDVDNAAYIPSTTAHRLFNVSNYQVIDVKVDKKENITQATRLVKSYMRRQLKDDEYSVLDQKQLLNTIDTILGAITTALGAIAAISLLVGGIGIMNIMLVSVTERTHEIGLRKAVGAKPGDIAVQFLIEAVFLSVVGGGIGILMAAGVSLIVSRFFQTVITSWSVILAFGISSLVGIVFGVAPAMRASRLNPIDALRYE